jgi:3-oxocholest-4-en-26-oyl-CoA dehydrogenase beta subunit
MDFHYSEEQRALQELAARLFAEHCSDEQRRQLRRSGEPYDAALWAALAEAGLLGTAISSDRGGAGLGLLELALLLEEQGRSLAEVPLLPTLVLGALPLARFGTPVQQALLAEVAAGRLLLSAALEEPAGTDPATPATSAAAVTGGWSLHGEKICVPYGAQAQRILVSAHAADGIRMFVLDPRTDGVRIEPQASTSGAPQARITLSGVTVGSAAALGAATAEVVSWTLARAQSAIAALQLGVLAEALRRAVGYVSERQQFGRPIGSFQAVQHRLADCYIDVEALRSVSLRALWALQEGSAAPAEVLAAKWWTAHAGHRVSHAVQHVHGGLGADLEYPIHAFFLRATELAGALGAGTPVLARIGAELAAGRVPAFT